jgi:hypothetical protein
LVVDQDLLSELAAEFAAYPDTYDFRGLENTPVPQDEDDEVDPVIARGEYLQNWYEFPEGNLRDSVTRDPDYQPKKRRHQQSFPTVPETFEVEISGREMRALNRETDNFYGYDDETPEPIHHSPLSVSRIPSTDDFDFANDDVGSLFGGTRHVRDDIPASEDLVQPLSPLLRSVSPVSSEASVAHYLLDLSPAHSVSVSQPQFHPSAPTSLDQPTQADDSITQSNLSPAYSASAPQLRLHSPSPTVSEHQPQVESTSLPPDQPLEVNFSVLVPPYPNHFFSL